MLLVWVFVISVRCFCPLGSHTEVVEIAFHDYATCEQTRLETSPRSEPCHLRGPQ
jgi:hypothetical protein